MGLLDDLDDEWRGRSAAALAMSQLMTTELAGSSPIAAELAGASDFSTHYLALDGRAVRNWALGNVLGCLFGASSIMAARSVHFDQYQLV